METTNKIVTYLKDNNQDLEFYPTTDEIIDCISKHIKYRLKTPEDIIKEMDDIKPEQTEELWNGSNKVTASLLALN